MNHWILTAFLKIYIYIYKQCTYLLSAVIYVYGNDIFSPLVYLKPKFMCTRRPFGTHCYLAR